MRLVWHILKRLRIPCPWFVGRYTIVIHDAGMYVAKDSVVISRLDWKFRPQEIVRCRLVIVRDE